MRKFLSSALVLPLAAGTSFLALAANPSTANESSDALKQQIVAQAKSISPEDYAFTRTVRVEQIEGEKTEQRIIIDRWDPTRPVEQRWTLVSIDGRAPKAEELTDYTKETPKRRVLSYGRIAGYFGSASTSSVDAKGRTIFRFAALPKETVMVGGSDLSASANCEASVNTTGAVPFVEQIRFNLVKPVRLKLVAKVESFEGTTRYRLMSDGKPVPAEQSSDMSGSMLGKQGRIRTTITFSDLRAVRG